MSKPKSFFLTSFFQMAAVFLLTETLFRVLSFPEVFNASFLRIECFVLSSAAILSLIITILPVPDAIRKLLVNFICWFFAVYAITELQFMNYYGSYMSVKASADGAGRIGEFVSDFIRLIKPVYYLALIPPLVGSLVSIHTVYRHPIFTKGTIIGALVCALLFEGAGRYLVRSFHLDRSYANTTFIDRSIREFGLGRFLMLDVLSTRKEEKPSLIMEEPTATPKETEVPAETGEPVRSRRNDIDDKSWISVMEQEEDEDLKTIDQFLMSRPLTDYNERTGMFEGYNVVYIMVEAFDYMGIDPELTPTLYKMKEEGWDFTHHYTPKFSCATGESEFVSEVSLVPMSDVCTPNQWAKNDWQNSIFNLFAHAGYYSSAYHNWEDEYYDRRILYANSGCEAYLNYDDLNYTRLWGWQSDLEMMELTVPYWINEDRFFTLYVTSSTHFPYDQGSELGNRYLNEISAVHPDYPIEVKRYISKSMELDKAMAYLLEQLEEAGKLDNTLIVMFADHHPLETAIKTLDDYGGYEADRLDGFNEDRTPLIFYTPTMEPEKLDRVNSTFDILPTVANLIGLPYEPRIYAGADYFDPASKLVIFPNGSWISDNGSYYASDDSHDDTLSEEEIEANNTIVENLFTVCRMIYNKNYFHYRQLVPFPEERK